LIAFQSGRSFIECDTFGQRFPEEIVSGHNIIAFFPMLLLLILSSTISDRFSIKSGASINDRLFGGCYFFDFLFFTSARREETNLNEMLTQL
jgi:hypothetical protein